MKLQTKEEYQKLLLSLLNPLRSKFTDECAGIRLSGAGAGYSKKVIEMEAFARPLWGLVPFWAGGGRDAVFEERYRKGIAAGTNPDNPEYWGVCGDCDQRFVEMAPIALGLLLTPGFLWDTLTDEEKCNTAAWLEQINHHELPKCNWYYFRILVNLALKARGCRYSGSLLESDLDYMEACCLGGGWYVDGVSEQKDYYSAFAMQFYSLLFAVFGDETDPERCRRFKQRALEFSRDYIYWFDDTGAALPYGRSLLYRFAQAAFWPAALFAEVPVFSPGVVKGLVNRNIRYWLAQDIFAGDGTLSVGYAYPNLTMAERYNAPGSPYWCMKTFLLLALPDDHPYWQADEEELPVLEQIHAIPEADMLLQHRGNEITAYVPAVYGKNLLGHFTEKYAKFAYSTSFGFSVAHSGDLLSECAPDSMLAFVPEKDERVCVRRRSIRYEVGADRVVSEWSPMAGVTVVTELVPTVQGHLRIHTIRSERACTAYDCGFAVGRMGEIENSLTVLTGDNYIEIKNPIQGCRLVSLEGEMTPFLIEADPNTNLLYRNTGIPALCRKISPGETVLKTSVETFQHKQPPG